MRDQDLQNSQPEKRVMDGVTIASGYARRLVEMEARATGRTVKDAVGPVARRLRASPGAVWGLLFRKPKQVSHDLVVALQSAVERHIERQIGDLENELAAIRAGGARLSPRDLSEAEESLARLRAAISGRE